jgi:hypothetical protein
MSNTSLTPIHWFEPDSADSISENRNNIWTVFYQPLNHPASLAAGEITRATANKINVTHRIPDWQSNDVLNASEAPQAMVWFHRWLWRQWHFITITWRLESCYRKEGLGSMVAAFGVSWKSWTEPGTPSRKNLKAISPNSAPLLMQKLQGRGFELQLHIPSRHSAWANQNAMAALYFIPNLLRETRGSHAVVSFTKSYSKHLTIPSSASESWCLVPPCWTWTSWLKLTPCNQTEQVWKLSHELNSSNDCKIPFAQMTWFDLYAQADWDETKEFRKLWSSGLMPKMINLQSGGLHLQGGWLASESCERLDEWCLVHLSL